RLAMTGWGGDVGVFRHCEALAEAIHGGSLVMLGGLGKWCWLSGRSLLFEAVLDGHGALRLAMTGWGDVAAEVFRHCEALAEAIQVGSLVMLGGLGKWCWLNGRSLLFEAVLDGRGALRLAMTVLGDVAAEVFSHCEALAEAIQVVFESINRFFPCLQRVYLFEHDWRRDQSCLMMPRSLSSSMTC
ncbi:hypothetical protein, partial [Nitrosomonas nitrosa]|uniref:hypothetical protein n=1 Tax=Nitrosomonas nitrosa TaxID=52442 RepID=UPI0023F774A2